MTNIKGFRPAALSLLCALTLLMPAPTKAQYIFTTNNGSLTIAGYTGFDASLVIPSSTNGMPIVAIGGAAFFLAYTLTNVFIPDSITNIGQYPFSACQNLQAFSVTSTNPTYTTVSGVLFNKAQNSLIQFPPGVGGTYTVPTGVTSINAGAFLGALLNSIQVSAGNPNFSAAAGILYDHSQTTLIQCPVGVSGSCTIPGTVTTIDFDAFEYCTHITSVSIPVSVTTMISNPFFDCSSVAAFTVAASNSQYSSLNGVLFNKAQTSLICYSLAVAGPYTVPNGVTTIGPGAFGHSAALTQVVLPDSVTTIGGEAFFNCPQLTSVTLSRGLTNLGSGAFQLTALTNLVIPSALTVIPAAAFANCPQLAGVYFVSNAPSVDSSAFAADNTATLYYLPHTSGWSSPFAGRPAILWNPLIQTQDGHFGVISNRFGFNVTSASNIVVEVEACTNLTERVWVPIQTLNVTNGSAHFTDAQWSSFRSRFYGLGFP